MKTAEKILSIVELAAYAAATVMALIVLGVLMRGGWF